MSDKAKKTQDPKQSKENIGSWDDLMELRKEVVNNLFEQQALITETIKKIYPLITEDTKLTTAIKGLQASFTDIAEKVKTNMNFHIKMDENNNIIEYKKGIIDQETDDIYDYIQIATNYINAKEQIAHLTTTGFLEIFTLVKSKNSELVNTEDLDNIKMAYVDGQKELVKTLKGVCDDIEQQPESSTTTVEEPAESNDK